jgi:PAS domain S-box-containing protein
MAQNITKTVTKTFFIGFTIIALLTNGFWFGSRYREDYQAFLQKVDATMTQFHSTIAFFLWQQNGEMITQKIDRFMEDPLRSAIILYTELPGFTKTFGLIRKNGKLVPYTSGALPKRTFFHKTAVIRYNGEHLGYVVIYFNTHFIRRRFLATLLYTIGSTLLFSLVGSILIYYRLRTVLSVVFDEILRILQAITNSNFHIVIPQHYTGDVGTIMHDLNTLSVTLDGVIEELKLKIIENDQNEYLTGIQALVFGNMQDGVIIIDNHTRTIFDWNQGAERIFGYAKPEVLGKSYDLLFPKIEPTFLEEVFENLRKFGSWSGRVAFLHRSQAPGICEVTIIKPIRPKDQRAISILLIRDVTKETETEALYEEVIELSPDPIFILHNHKIVFINKAFTTMLHYTKQELQERPLAKVLFLDSRGNERCVLDEESPLQRCVLKDRYHQYHAVEVSQTPILFHHSPARLIVARDLSERLGYEETLLEKISTIEHLTHAIVTALENINRLNDTSTGTHIHRIAAYSTVLAKQHGCSQACIDDINLYAPLHDIGKVALSDAVLKKAGKYTDEEREAMKQHVTFGAQIVESIAGVSTMAYNIVAYHHEWWNGNGYMKGLKGEEIPLEAHIVAIADTFDAIISSRVYKSAHTIDETIYLMRQESGTHFNPALLDSFFEVLNDIVAIYHKFQQENGLQRPAIAPISADACPSALDFRVSMDRDNEQND